VSNFNHLKVWPAAAEMPSPRRVYVESSVRLHAYQRNRFFQAAVVETSVFASPRKQKLLYSQKEPRSPEQVVNESFLREGITLDLTPIHTFSIFGERLLEPLYEYEMRDSDCQPRDRHESHRTLYCKNDWRLGVTMLQIGRLYIGGRLVKLEFFNPEAAESKTVKFVEAQIWRDLPAPKDANLDQALTWRTKQVEVDFDRPTLTKGSLKKPFLVVRPDSFYRNRAESDKTP
jgi:hypothetical protein